MSTFVIVSITFVCFNTFSREFIAQFDLQIKHMNKKRICMNVNIPMCYVYYIIMVTTILLKRTLRTLRTVRSRILSIQFFFVWQNEHLYIYIVYKYTYTVHYVLF